jgi:hypothetical protein
MWLLTLAACNVVNAPDTAQELAVFGFVHAEGPDAFPEVFVDELSAWAETNRSELEQGLWVEALDADDLQAVGVDADPDVDVVGAMGVATYSSSLAEIAEVITHPHLDEVFEATTSYALTSSDDRVCFLDGDCATYRFRADRGIRMGLLGPANQAVEGLVRWVDHGDSRALMLRTLSPDRAQTGPLIELDQQYLLSLFYEGQAGQERVDIVWAEARLVGIDLPDSVIVDMAVANMEDAATQVDAWIAAN